MMRNSPTSFVRDCSIENSFYRCAVIHGTHFATITRNVAYNITGHCYYLEDGVEENNTISYNLAALVKVIGKPAAGEVQEGELTFQSENLENPVDAGAAGFYITNAYNTIIGNAASGGWAGFSFPNLNVPIGLHRNVIMEPSARPTLEFDGNTVSDKNSCNK